MTVALTGYEPVEHAVSVAAGKLRPLAFDLTPNTLEVEPSRLAPGASGPGASTGVDAVLTEESMDGGLSFAPWAIIGSGGAALVTGVVLSAMAEAEGSALETMEAPAEEGLATQAAAIEWRASEDRVATYRGAAIAMYALSAAAITGGVLWLALSGDEGEPTDPGTAFYVVPTHTGVMTGATWRF